MSGTPHTNRGIVCSYSGTATVGGRIYFSGDTLRNGSTIGLLGAIVLPLFDFTLKVGRDNLGLTISGADGAMELPAVEFHIAPMCEQGGKGVSCLFY